MSADLKALKALALAATPGPWERDTIRSEGEYGSDDDGGYGFDSYEVTDAKGLCIMDCLNNDDGAVSVGQDGHAWDDVAKRNAAFVAAANPAIILALIERLEAAEAAPLPAEQPSELRTFLLNHITRLDGGVLEQLHLAHNDVWALRQLLRAEQPSNPVPRMGGNTITLTLKQKANIGHAAFVLKRDGHAQLADSLQGILARIVGQQTKGGGK